VAAIQSYRPTATCPISGPAMNRGAFRFRDKARLLRRSGNHDRQNNTAHRSWPKRGSGKLRLNRRMRRVSRYFSPTWHTVASETQRENSRAAPRNATLFTDITSFNRSGGNAGASVLGPLLTDYLTGHDRFVFAHEAQSRRSSASYPRNVWRPCRAARTTQIGPCLRVGFG